MEKQKKALKVEDYLMIDKYRSRTFKLIKTNPKKMSKFKRKYKRYISSFMKYITFALILVKKRINLKFYITIRLGANNMFCTLKHLKKNKTIFSCSAGKYKLNVSKKKLKFMHKIILHKFFLKIKRYLKTKIKILVKLISPVRIRKVIIKRLKMLFKKNTLILNLQENKCYNGCRPKKQKKKKRKGFRLFK